MRKRFIYISIALCLLSVKGFSATPSTPKTGGVNEIRLSNSEVIPLPPGSWKVVWKDEVDLCANQSISCASLDGRVLVLQNLDPLIPVYAFVLRYTNSTGRNWPDAGCYEKDRIASISKGLVRSRAAYFDKHDTRINSFENKCSFGSDGGLPKQSTDSWWPTIREGLQRIEEPAGQKTQIEILLQRENKRRYQINLWLVKDNGKQVVPDALIMNWKALLVEKMAQGAFNGESIENQRILALDFIPLRDAKKVLVQANIESDNEIQLIIKLNELQYQLSQINNKVLNNNEDYLILTEKIVAIQTLLSIDSERLRELNNFSEVLNIANGTEKNKNSLESLGASIELESNRQRQTDNDLTALISTANVVMINPDFLGSGTQLAELTTPIKNASTGQVEKDRLDAEALAQAMERERLAAEKVLADAATAKAKVERDRVEAEVLAQAKERSRQADEKAVTDAAAAKAKVERDRVEAEALAQAKERSRLSDEKAVADAAAAKAQVERDRIEAEALAQAKERERLSAEKAVADAAAAKAQVEREQAEALAKSQMVLASADYQSLRSQMKRLQDELQRLKTETPHERVKEPAKQKENLAPRYGLVFGNAKYEFVSPLDNSVTDARSFASALSDLGFKVSLHLDLGERDFNKAVRRFKDQLVGGEEVIFYYAGHGVQIASTNYLLPTDVGGDSADQVKDESIDLQRILDSLSEKETKFTLAVVDACRDNPFKKNGRAIAGRGLAPTSAATGQMIIFSAGAGQQALDKLGNNDKEPNGLFTRIFLKEMRKPGIPVDTMLRSVRKEVVRLAKGVGHDQVPALYDQTVGEFYFNPN